MNNMINDGKPKPPRPPSGMSAPMPPDDGMDMESPDDEKAETATLDGIMAKLDKICEALGLHDGEGYDEPEAQAPAMDENEQ